MAAIMRVFSSFRMFIILLTGFSCGIPLGLTASTLQTWLKSDGVDLSLIGAFSLVGLPYTLKFLWAPLMDRFTPPFLGRRRGWALIAQLALIVGICAMSATHPSLNPGRMAFLAILVAFCSASQDIVLDAYRTEVLTRDEYGAGAGVYILGYRLAMLTSGAVALILSDHMSWNQVYLVMAACLGVGLVASVIAPEPATHRPPPQSLQESFVGPLKDFFKREGAAEILIFILIYKLGDVLTAMMTTPLLLDLGFSRTDIGAVNKGFGLVATIVGGLFGGGILSKIGIHRGLWVFGISQAISNLTFALLSVAGHQFPVMIGAIGIENLCSGMNTAAFSAFLMALCNQRFSAGQYALLTSLMAVTRVFAGAPSGYLAKHMGYTPYFLFTSAMAIPGLLLLTRYAKWTGPDSEAI